MLGHAFVECVVDNDVPVCHTCNLRHFVAYEHNRCRRCHIGDDAVEVLLEVFVEIAQRFVKHEHGRSAHYCSGKECTLQLSA